jgi:hypothetical protein
MNDALFDCRASKVVPSSTAVVAPLATIAMSFHCGEFETAGLNPDEEYALQNGARLKRFHSLEGTADVLMGAIRPQLPPNLRAEGCAAAIWRVRVNTRLRELRFSCYRAVQSAEVDGAPNSGEGLDAFTWRFEHGILSIASPISNLGSFFRSTSLSHGQSIARMRVRPLGLPSTSSQFTCCGN